VRDYSAEAPLKQGFFSAFRFRVGVQDVQGSSLGGYTHGLPVSSIHPPGLGFLLIYSGAELPELRADLSYIPSAGVKNLYFAQ